MQLRFYSFPKKADVKDVIDDVSNGSGDKEATKPDKGGTDHVRPEFNDDAIDGTDQRRRRRMLQVSASPSVSASGDDDTTVIDDSKAKVKEPKLSAEEKHCKWCECFCHVHLCCSLARDANLTRSTCK
jgi:hypothetical protein